MLLFFFFLPLIVFFPSFFFLSSSCSVLFYDSAAQMPAFIDAALFHGLLYSSVIGKLCARLTVYVLLRIILYYPSEQSRFYSVEELILYKKNLA